MADKTLTDVMPPIKVVDLLDNTHAIAVAIEDMGPDLTAAFLSLETRLNRMRAPLDFPSLLQAAVTIPAIAADQALPSVTVAGIPAGATVTRAIAMFKYGGLYDSAAAANKLKNAQEIQIRTDAPGAWNDCINLVDDACAVAAATPRGGDVIFGAIDVTAVVAGNDTYNFQWDEAIADSASLVFQDVQMIIRVWYSV